MNATDRINAALAAPMTHRVVTRYDDGFEKTHDTRSLAAARNWAIGESYKIGKTLVCRETGVSREIVLVRIDEIRRAA